MEGGTETAVEWWAKARQSAKLLPDSFSGVKATVGGQWSDTPWATMSRGDEIIVSLPTKEPKDEKVLSIFGLFLSLLDKAKIKTVPCTGSQVDPWHAFTAVKDSIHGACLCLKRDQISPVDTIPVTLKNGWDYALWYCQSAVSKVNEHNEFFKIRRVTSLSLTRQGQTQWQAGGQLSELTRLDTIVRLAAKNLAVNLSDPKGFLKGKGYFMDKCVGKKPIRGLYTDSEFAYSTKEWDERNKRVEMAYKAIPSTWAGIRSEVNGFRAHLERIQESGRRSRRDIEEAVVQRLKILSFVPTKGRDKQSKIVPGATLRDKILNADLRSVRQPAFLMWSPLYEVSAAQFSDCVLNVARNHISHGNNVATAVDIESRSREKGDPVLISMQANRLAYLDAAACYGELYSSRASDESWVAMFGNPKH
jgi:hypothetical protein